MGVQVRKTFITLTYCSVCEKAIWLNGYRCQMCLVKFHQKCWAQVPTHCEHVRPINRDLLEYPSSSSNSPAHLTARWRRLQKACIEHSGPEGSAIQTLRTVPPLDWQEGA